MELISYAPDAWRLLNGVFCIYKPAGLSINRVKNTVIGNICRDLNQLKVRPAAKCVEIIGSSDKPMSVNVVPNYADNPLVLGPRYQPQDIRCSWATVIGMNISGVSVLGINNRKYITQKIHEGRHLRAYHVKGQLGYATDTHFTDGKVFEKATYDHVTAGKFNQKLAAIQGSHQKQMFQYAGLDMESQEAYELASKGPLRPSDWSPPVFYSIKAIEFSPPDFTLEIHCINEYEDYFKTLIHDLGIALKTCATCTQIRCIRYGFFTLEHALLRKHWTLENILNNITLCDKLLQKHGGPTPSTATLQEGKVDNRTLLEMLEPKIPLPNST